ncbi:hypothetical protein PQO03_13660 [Lentisphaera profundi]|uniref:Uncharacterized protein n=1 Tax=Lentisphaera profundi TaxID=1658616 RepID=A0ABY7VY84_9BACT|nr:hypothetical protein [Lentisphaera profundi]WDE98881.1 hypothetical protein PQO03_13660 [Lentisphaera profundi]
MDGREIDALICLTDLFATIAAIVEAPLVDGLATDLEQKNNLYDKFSERAKQMANHLKALEQSKATR